MAERLLDYRRIRRRVLRQRHELAAGRIQIHLVSWRKALLPGLPLAGNAQDHPDASSGGVAQRGGLWHLDVELIDEQERHAGLEIVEHLLVRGLLQLASDDEADEAVLSLRAGNVELRRLYGAADIADR